MFSLFFFFVQIGVALGIGVWDCWTGLAPYIRGDRVGPAIGKTMGVIAGKHNGIEQIYIN
jgi:hypothetical protein